MDVDKEETCNSEINKGGREEIEQDNLMGRTGICSFVLIVVLLYFSPSSPTHTRQSDAKLYVVS